MDENKVVGLIDKLYIEMQNMRSDMQNMRSDMQAEFKNVRSEMQDGFEVARLDRVRIEHTITEKINFISDGVLQNTNRLDRLELKVTNVEELIKERSIVVPKDYYVKLLKKVENE